jgi:hypothetical protein
MTLKWNLKKYDAHVDDRTESMLAALSYGNETFISAGEKFLGWLSGLNVRESLCSM